MTLYKCWRLLKYYLLLAFNSIFFFAAFILITRRIRIQFQVVKVFTFFFLLYLHKAQRTLIVLSLVSKARINTIGCNCWRLIVFVQLFEFLFCVTLILLLTLIEDLYLWREVLILMLLLDIFTLYLLLRGIIWLWDLNSSSLVLFDAKI